MKKEMKSKADANSYRTKRQRRVRNVCGLGDIENESVGVDTLNDVIDCVQDREEKTLK